MVLKVAKVLPVGSGTIFSYSINYEITKISYLKRGLEEKSEEIFKGVMHVFRQRCLCF